MRDDKHPSNGRRIKEFVVVQEFMGGGDLYELIVPEIGVCDVILLKRYILQLCSGLSYLHRHNIAHRDVKPENIALSSDLQNLKSHSTTQTVQTPSG
eukprot:Pgem_evm1s19001